MKTENEAEAREKLKNLIKNSKYDHDDPRRSHRVIIKRDDIPKELEFAIYMDNQFCDVIGIVFMLNKEYLKRIRLFADFIIDNDLEYVTENYYEPVRFILRDGTITDKTSRNKMCRWDFPGKVKILEVSTHMNTDQIWFTGRMVNDAQDREDRQWSKWQSEVLSNYELISEKAKHEAREQRLRGGRRVIFHKPHRLEKNLPSPSTNLMFETALSSVHDQELSFFKIIPERNINT